MSEAESERRTWEQIQYYSLGYWELLKRMREPDMQNPYDQDRFMETINYNHNRNLLYSLEPYRSFCIGVLHAQAWFEKTRFIPN